MSSHDDHSGRVERSTAQRVAILLLAILQVALPSLPALGIGEPIGEQSDSVDTLITPAGWAFSIWGFLYTGSLIYAVYQLLPSQSRNGLLDRIGWPSAGAFLGNALWALYTQSFGLSVISALIIIFTLACLLAVFRAFIEPGRALTRGEQFLVVLPLSALASWLTAATIVNISASLTFHGVGPLEGVNLIAAAVVVVGGIIAAAAIWTGRGNPWYALVFLWALAGIYAAADVGSVDLAVILAAMLVIGATFARLSRERDRKHWIGASV